MAQTRKAQDKDVISQIADAGEDVLRQLFSLPRRIVAGTLDGLGNGLHNAARKLGKVDQLDGRVTALEKRLESLEKPAKAGRTASTHTQPSEQRREHERAQANDGDEHAQ